MANNPLQLVRDFLTKKREQSLFRKSSNREIFSYIYENNKWGDGKTRSGKGSSLEHTANLRKELPPLLRRLEIRSLLDIPCGDFHWMKETDLDLDVYYGADIVPAIVQANINAHAADNRKFLQLDLLHDTLPITDGILCRECLVHFSLADAQQAISNIKATGARYLLATHFPDLENNKDILTGKHRPLNMGLPPFSWPAQLAEIVEVEKAKHGRKCLAVWAIQDLP